MIIFFDVSGVLLEPQFIAAVLSKRGSLVPGMREVVIGLKERGDILITVSSLSQSSLDHYLDEWKLTAYFDHTVSSFDKAADMRDMLDVYNLEAHEAIMITDTPNDIRAAMAVGIATIGVTWGFGERRHLEEAGATHIVDSPAEIVSFCTKKDHPISS